MAGPYDYNILLDTEFTYQQYAPPVTPPPDLVNISGNVTIINTINGGGGGQATGPTITISGGSTGMNFVASGSAIALEGTLIVANGGTGATSAAGARSNLGAAASGVNTDITQLNGASQVDVSSHYAVSGTQVVTAQQPAIPDVSGGVTIDTEARAAINTLLAALRVHGLIDT